MVSAMKECPRSLTRSFRFRYERGFDLTLIDRYPIGTGKPFVRFDVVDTILQIAVTFRQIHLQKIA